MKNKITIMLFLLYSNSLCMHFETLLTNPSKNDPNIEEISKALQKDSFFKDIYLKKFLGSGSYGSVYSASKDGKNYAIKITSEAEVDKIPEKISEEELKLPDGEITDIYVNLRFLKYLKQENVPFILKTYTDRNVLIQNKDAKPKIKNVWLQEYADLIDMEKLATKLKSKDDDFKYKVVIILLYRLAYAFDKIANLDIIHGDLKPQNIFMKTCNIEGKKGGYGDSDKDIPEPIYLCPIIGDWDLAHYIKSGYTTQIRYTSLYRPIEMFRLSSENSLWNRRGLYLYTKKEDVYALGMSIIHLILNLNLSLEKPCYNNLKNLLENMIKPISYADAVGILTYKLKPKHVNVNFDLETNHSNNLDKIKNYYEEIVKNISTDIQDDCNLKLTNYKNRYPKFEQISYYYTLKYCIIIKYQTTTEDIKSLFEKNGGKDKSAEFYKTMNEIKTYNAAEMISKDRYTMEETLSEITNILQNDETVKKMVNLRTLQDTKLITEKILEDTFINGANIDGETKEESPELDKNRETIYKGESCQQDSHINTRKFSKNKYLNNNEKATNNGFIFKPHTQSKPIPNESYDEIFKPQKLNMDLANERKIPPINQNINLMKKNEVTNKQSRLSLNNQPYQINNDRKNENLPSINYAQKQGNMNRASMALNESKYAQNKNYLNIDNLNGNSRGNLKQQYGTQFFSRRNNSNNGINKPNFPMPYRSDVQKGNQNFLPELKPGIKRRLIL